MNSHNSWNFNLSRSYSGGRVTWGLFQLSLAVPFIRLSWKAISSFLQWKNEQSKLKQKEKQDQGESGREW